VSGLFITKEFKFMTIIAERLMKLNTPSNIENYEKYRDKCIRLAQQKYNNIGWRSDEKSYAWLRLKISELGPTMTCMGDYDDASPYPGHTLYMSEDFSQMALKDEDGKIWDYTKDETSAMRECSLKEFQRIHHIKINFEGRIKDGKEKGKHTGRSNKEKVKRTR